MAVEPAQIYGFLGPNGAGKSTTIRILMGLYRPSAGVARVLGHDCRYDAVAIHRRTGYLPGELAFPAALTGREILTRFARVRGMTDTTYRDMLVERFGAELDRPIRTLSKGNRQKIGLVAAFMHRPELLVLDEPTSGLDPLLQEEFCDLLRETADEGRTVLLSSHDLAEVQRVVHRLSIIKEGKIVVSGTVDELRAHAPRTFEVTFDQPVSADRFDTLDGLRAAQVTPNRLRLFLSGPIAPCLKAVAALEPIDFEARPVDLDELFLSYYRGEESSNAGQEEKPHAA
ncbi:transport ATP-binding protein [Streptomyces pluripotens]|uniref:Transport ATP-binding protein n=2 Tax=Streptomyces TaxID=1883 RepID=A0A221P7B7_9ACTN|nr:transport ATP-binding protein [Streptomyces pluripotens]MCH0558177.1 ABC transporter ATP-binding protein [Streptomyces sp. MUM 16J]